MIPRAGQVRLTERGLAPIADVLERELARASALSCSSDADCPNFVDAQGGAIATTCDLLRSQCFESGANQPTPGLRLVLPASASGRTACRGTGPCALEARLEDLAVAPLPGTGARLTVALQLADAELPVADFGQGLDCLLTVDGQRGNVLAQFDLALLPQTTPGTRPQLVADLTTADVQLPAALLALSPDPVFGGPEDQAGCNAAALNAFRGALEVALEAEALPLAQSLLGQAIGKPCDLPAECGAGATCTAEGWCRSNSGSTIVPEALDFEERLLLPYLLGSVGYGGEAAPADGALLIGGTFDADAAGLGFGILAGLLPVANNPRCARPLPSPHLRPGFVAPSPLPATTAADLDFDGAPETPYGIAFGASQALLHQLVHAIYQSGLLCGTVTTRDIDVHTGTLEILIPSLRFLTKSHLYPRSERPVRLSVYLADEPELNIDSGRTVDNGTGPEYPDPVLRVKLRGLQLNLQVLIDERWTRVLTVDLDLNLGLGLMVTPANELVPLVGVGVSQIIENVRVSNSELLLESPASLESAIPTLVSFAFLEFSGAQDAIPLPPINGVDYQILGVRGVQTGGVYDQLVVYADLLGIQTSNLSATVETQAQLQRLEVPATAAFAVDHPGGPQLPKVHLNLPAQGPDGQVLEHQYALDGGGWSPFTRGAALVVARPELLLQGRHHLEVRSRLAADYRSLDPTPTVLEFSVDSEPPRLVVQEVQGSLQIQAWDRVSLDRLSRTVQAGDHLRPVSLGEGGLLRLSDEEQVAAPLVVRATDEAGLTAEVVLRAAPLTAASEASPETSSGCRAVETRGNLPWAWTLALGLLLVRRRRR